MTVAVRALVPADLAQATWADVAVRYDALLAQPLDAATLEAWLADWSHLEAVLSEAASRAMIAYTCNTADAAAEAAHRRFSVEILPYAEEKSTAMARRYAAVADDDPARATMRRRFRTQVEIFREANVPLTAQLEELGTEYQRITGGMTATWEGEQLPLPRLAPFLKRTDRAVRERAFHAANGPYVRERPALAALFDRMLPLRQQVARNAGFANYRDYVFPAKNRFDYTPADCARFHDAVEAAVVPAVARLHARRRATLGLDALRPWDLLVDLDDREWPPAFGDGRELAEVGRRVFTAVDPALGREFGTMVDEGYLDLDSRQGKAPGGYCDTLHASGRPFIFMNAVGVVEDVMTLLHEAGHAFHAFAAHPLPLIWQRFPGSEAAELASMSMELLAAPFLARPTGYFEPADARRAWAEHLEDVLVTLAHIATVDAFQQWIYTTPEGADAAARDRRWLDLRARFEPGVDWTGLEAERVARWYRQLHIFLHPFYYIEYGIAQLGALQVWRNSRRDAADAVRRYRAALALGATRDLPAIFAEAGATLSFEPALMAELVGMVEEAIAEARAA